MARAALADATDSGHACRGSVAGFMFAGEWLELHPEGAAFFPAHGLAVVADLHLEKSTAFAAQGQMLPPYETLETLRRLLRLVEVLRPERLVLLGDSFHSAVEAIGEGGPARAAIDRLAAACALTWVAGNHDPAPPLRLPGHWVESIQLGDCILRHAPIDDGQDEIVGHLHPAARLATRAGSQRRRCFVLARQRLLLPAFGSLTGMVDLGDPAILRHIPGREARVFMMCQPGLVEVPLSACLR